MKFKNNFFGYFNFYYRVLGKRLLFNLFLSVLVSFLDGLGLTMFIPLLQATDGHSFQKQSLGQLHYITDAIESLGFKLNINTVLTVLVLLFILKGILKFIQLNYQVKLRQLFMKKIRYDLVNKLQGMSYEKYLKLDAGRIQNTLIAEVQRLFQTLSFYFNAAQGAVMLTTYIGLAFMANYQFAILVAAGAGLSNFLFKRIYVATKKASIAFSKKGNDFNSLLIQSVHNFKYLKATNYFTNFSKKLKLVITETESLNRKMGFYTAVTTSIKEPMIIGVVALVIFLQLNFMQTSIGAIMLSLLLFYRALSYLMVVQTYWQNFIQNVGAMDSIANITNELTDAQEIQTGQTFDTFKDEINISNVSFGYENHPVLKGVSINIKKNNTIALVGESGSGKTTIANMIAGLIAPQSGKILIDNVPLNQISLNSYRSKIGYISQEPVVFNDNIFNNITFWSEPTAANKEHFWKALKLASLEDFVLAQPDKEYTHLGDNGLLISGGQKQRISIARELYKDSEILILDEATSALDSETEKIIQDNIENLQGSYTMIIIAHRLSTIKHANAIYLMEGGAVSAMGTFEEMLNVSARFRRMVELQEF